ncbi:TetR/AcrR family transcriptional regulator [Quadrisphaera sp. KR29]|uniref:TetR/AcrR family transcriptional regulator n=1 Tax=Quadrisphaera sp. KR29 TaxID=3461391 RepID=UPI004043CBAD
MRAEAAKVAEPAASPGGKRAQLSRRRREEILDAGLGLFAESGFRGTSLRDIATRADLTHAGVLYHFADKEQLLVAVLLRRDEQVSARHHLVSEDGLEVLRGFLALARENAANRQIVELFATLSGEAAAAAHPAHRYFADRYSFLVDTLRGAIANLRSRGLLQRGEFSDDQIARQLIAVSDGLQVQWLMSGCQLDLAGEIAAFVQPFVGTQL